MNVSSRQRFCTQPIAVAIACATLGLSAGSVAQEGEGAEVRRSTTDALLEEVTVTARKREERAQDTPIAITAFNAEAIEARGVTKTDDIAQFAPNLTFQNSPGYGGSTNTAAVYIRGIGQFDFLGSIEPGVGTYIDGVYIARSIGGVMDLVDVERIEILRGPQGTLFGRNTIGGAIAIFTKKPSDELDIRGEVTYGDDENIVFKGSVSGPVTSNLQGKLTVRYNERDGYVEEIATGRDLGNKDNFSALAQLNWQPTENINFGFSFDYTRDRSNGAPWVLRGANFTSQIFNPDNRPLIPPRAASPFAVDESERPLIPAAALPPGANVPGAQGQIAPGSIPFLPPGVDPTASYYELNVQQVPGAPPGTLAPFDVPVDNFIVLNNYVATFLGGQPCISPVFAPYDATFSESDACYSERFFESNLGKNKNAGTFPTFSATDIYGFSGNFEWDIGPMQIVSVTAYRDMNSNFDVDSDYTPLLISHLQDWFDQWQFSQELQLKGTSFEDRLTWIIGGYYFKEEVDNQNDVFFPPVSVRSGGLIDNKSYAAFAQATYTITDPLKLTVGFRYTKDNKRFDSGPYQYIFETRTPAFPACTLPTREGCPVNTLTIFDDPTATQKASEWTPYVNLAYNWTDSLMTYFSFSEGFKSGGFTQRIFPPLPEPASVDPEFVTVYEGGFKSDWLDGRFRLNGAVFYTDYSDLQVQGFTSATGVAPIYRNAAAAHVLGFELDAQWSPAEGWFLEGSVGYLDDEYDEIDQGVLIGLDLTDRFERVSKWSGAFAIQKEFLLEDNFGALVPRVDVAYRSKFYNDATNLEPISQDGYAVVNGALRWASANGNWSLTGNVRNIFDEDYIHTAIFNNSIQQYNAVPNRGREWSLTLSVDIW